MTLYFAYGANMERAAMRKRCPRRDRAMASRRCAAGAT